MVLVCIAAAMVSCSSDKGEDLSKVCAHISESGKLPTCTALYDGLVGLRLPAGNQQKPYGAVTQGAESFITADGTKIPLSESAATSLGSNNNYASTIYRAVVSGGRVRTLTAQMRVSENAIMNHVFAGRILVGKISTRNADGTFNFDPVLPLVIRLDDAARSGEIHGTIVNATSTVALPSGACMAALNRTAKNPLVGDYTPKVSITRIPSMHARFQDTLVLAWTDSSSGMGSEFYPSAATLLGHDPLGKKWEVVQHGVPSSGPSVGLKFGKGPIQTCG